MSHINNQLNSGRFKALAVSCLLALTLASCSSGSSDNNTGTGDAQQAAADGQQTTGSMEGTWDYCTGSSLRNTYVFSGNSFEQYLAYFEASDCSGTPLTSDGLQPYDVPFVTGTFELLEEFTTDSGVTARKLDMTANTFGSVQQYRIVYLGTAGQMVFGTAQGYSEEDRPTALDFDNPYLQR